MSTDDSSTSTDQNELSISSQSQDDCSSLSAESSFDDSIWSSSSESSIDDVDIAARDFKSRISMQFRQFVEEGLNAKSISIGVLALLIFLSSIVIIIMKIPFFEKEPPKEIASMPPSSFPSKISTELPSIYPSQASSSNPSVSPSIAVTEEPSYIPSVSVMPTFLPSIVKSTIPSSNPSSSVVPSALPSNYPTQSPMVYEEWHLVQWFKGHTFDKYMTDRNQDGIGVSVSIANHGNTFAFSDSSNCTIYTFDFDSESNDYIPRTPIQLAGGLYHGYECQSEVDLTDDGRGIAHTFHFLDRDFQVGMGSSLIWNIEEKVWDKYTKKLFLNSPYAGNASCCLGAAIYASSNGMDFVISDWYVNLLHVFHGHKENTLEWVHRYTFDRGNYLLYQSFVAMSHDGRFVAFTKNTKEKVHDGRNVNYSIDDSIIEVYAWKNEKEEFERVGDSISKASQSSHNFGGGIDLELLPNGNLMLVVNDCNFDEQNWDGNINDDARGSVRIFDYNTSDSKGNWNERDYNLSIPGSLYIGRDIKLSRNGNSIVVSSHDKLCIFQNRKGIWSHPMDSCFRLNPEANYSKPAKLDFLRDVGVDYRFDISNDGRSIIVGQPRDVVPRWSEEDQLDINRGEVKVFKLAKPLELDNVEHPRELPKWNDYFPL
ncbi:hypothetical protein CTEN210_00544 [Chaetoceros tenuissimus]|uniref:Uncharacterized protein n=1 Tax=Chaetoceros tenuissimus TaxID=426638 RepID=A0AAD3CG91_9STRA|nr:hypothetical protein CTEN210_00544 [Chaetoceros tenuissimus]